MADLDGEAHRELIACVEWQLAAEMLLGAAERGGMVMLAEIAVRRALNGKPKGPPPESRRRSARAYKLIK